MSQADQARAGLISGIAVAFAVTATASVIAGFAWR